MGDHIVRSDAVSNIRYVRQIPQSLVKNKLSSSEPAHFFDGWPFTNLQVL